MTLQDWLKAEKLSHEQFAAKIRIAGKPVSVQAVGKWARGERLPRPKAMSAIESATEGAVTWADMLSVFQARAERIAA